MSGDESGVLTVTGSTTETIGQIAFDNGVVIHEIATLTSNLEETFLDLTSDPVQEARS